MPEYVRVKDKDTGHKFSVIASAVDEGAMQVLKQDATDVAGDPLAPEYAEPKTGQSAAPKKENG